MGSTWGQPVVNLGLIWGQPGVNLGSIWGQPEVNLGSSCTALPLVNSAMSGDAGPALTSASASTSVSSKPDKSRTDMSPSSRVIENKHSTEIGA